MKVNLKFAITLVFCVLTIAISSAQAQELFQGEYYKIVNRHSGKCLDVEGFSTDTDARVHQWDCHGDRNQQWQLEQVSGATGPALYKIQARHSGKVLNVNSSSTLNFATVHQRYFNFQDNQKWSVVPLGGGYFKIIVRHSGKALEVKDYSRNNSGQIVQYDFYGGENQQWRLEQVYSSYSSCGGAGSYGFPIHPWVGIRSSEDTIDYGETYGRDSRTNQIRIELSSAPHVTWWKSIEVLDAENNVMDSVSTEGRSLGPTVMIIPVRGRGGRNPSTLKLKFLKAKAFGVHTGMYTLCNLSGQVGKTLYFRWSRD